ncbi:MAG: hypothetical protein WCJ62_09575 [Flavobacterium sp.]
MEKNTRKLKYKPENIQKDLSTQEPQNNKLWYLEYGVNREKSFVDVYNQYVRKGDMEFNKNKEENVYLPDLMLDNKEVELKTHETPFFTSLNYGIPPEFCFSFGSRPSRRYQDKLDLPILVWYNPLYTISKFGSVSNKASGIYSILTKDILVMIEEKGKKHTHLGRIDDMKNNDKANFLLDIRDFNCLIKFDGVFDNESALRKTYQKYPKGN